MALDHQIRKLEEFHRLYGGTEVTVEYVMTALQISERKDAVSLLQRAQKRGMGKFVLGRGSNKTRIVWKDVEQPAPTHDQPTMATETRDKSRPYLDYIFPLDEFNVEMKLPRDLTLVEAERIARFVNSIARDR